MSVRVEINDSTPPGLFHYESGASFDSVRQQRGAASFSLFIEPDVDYMPALNSTVRIFESDDDVSPAAEYCAWYGTIRRRSVTWVGNAGHHLIRVEAATPEAAVDTALMPRTTYAGGYTGAQTITNLVETKLLDTPYTIPLTLGTIDADTVMEDVTYREGARLSDILDRTALIARKQWYANPREGTLNMGAIDSNPAPRDITTVVQDSLSWEQSLDDYRSDPADPSPTYGATGQRATLVNKSTTAAAQQEQDAIIAAYNTAPPTFSCTVDVPGFYAGQWVTVNLDKPEGAGELLNGGWLIQSVRATLIPGKERLSGSQGHFRYQLELIKQLDVPTDTDFWEDAMNTGNENEDDTLVDTVVHEFRLLVKNTAVRDNAADHVPVLQDGYARRIVAVLSKEIAADLTVRFNIANSGSPSPLELATVTIPASTAVDEVLEFDLSLDISPVTSPPTYPLLYERDVLWPDILASDGSADEYGIATFTIEQRRMLNQDEASAFEANTSP